ncbi:MAG: guanylate kinase [Bacilli bacterium]|nr:guanylate kinase [Bacilli bacterium]
MMKGLLIVLSGPSGVGKGTVRKVLMQDESLNIAFSISMTTRAPRNGEVDGVEYFFVSEETFQENIKNGELLEYARFVGHSYGTPRSYVEKLRNEGKNVLLEIETNGARQVMEKYSDDPKFVSIFLLPPDEVELEARIRGRQTEAEDVIQERLAKSKKELKLSNLYMYKVINTLPEQAAKEISDIIKSKIN